MVEIKFPKENTSLQMDWMRQLVYEKFCTKKTEYDDQHSKKKQRSQWSKASQKQ